MSELKDHVEAAMGVAKGIVAGGDELSPVVVFFKAGMPNLPIPLKLATDEDRELSIRLTQTFILKFHPDFAVLVTEGWLLDVRKSSPEEVKEFIESYTHGDAAKSPKRIEVIMIHGGRIGEQYSAIQPYKRKGKKIIFQEQVVTPDNAYMDCAFFGNAWEILEKEGKVLH